MHLTITKKSYMRLITFISAGVFIVCSAFIMKKGNQQKASSLYETKWSLKKIYTTTGIEEVNTKAFIKFDKEKKSAGGNGSCNTFGSTTTIDKNEISFKNIFSTKMYCQEVQQTENAFFINLGKATRYEIDDNVFKLYNDKELLLEFESE